MDGYKPPKFEANLGKKEFLMSTILEKDYVPSEKEPFMNERQLAYFRAKLLG